MYHRFLTFAFGVWLVLLASARASAQITLPADTTSMVVVQTIDGNEFVGRILSHDSEVIALKTEYFGTVSIQKVVVKSIRLLRSREMKNGQYWYENPHASLYYAGPTAYGLRKGEGYFENALAIFNQFSYGLSDQFSLSAGAMPLLVFDGPMPVWVRPKFSIPLKPEKVNLAIGGIYGRVFSNYDSDVRGFGAVFGLVTFGPRDANVSGGIGFGFENGNWSRKPVVALSGTARLGRWFALISENYFIKYSDQSNTIMSLGGRFLLRRIALDGGFWANAIESDGFYPIPWLGIHLLFGSQKR